MGTFSPNQDAVITFLKSTPSIKDFTTKDIYKYELAKHIDDNLMVEIVMQNKEPNAKEGYRFVKTTTFTAKPKHYFFEELNARAGTRPNKHNTPKQKSTQRTRKKAYRIPTSTVSRTRHNYKLSNSRREKYNVDIKEVKALQNDLTEVRKQRRFNNPDRMAMK